MAEELANPPCLIVADHDVLIRNGLAEYLRHCGYKVFEAATSDEVIIALEEGATSFQAMLVDAELSGELNAFELRMWVRGITQASTSFWLGTSIGPRRLQGTCVMMARISKDLMILKAWWRTSSVYWQQHGAEFAAASRRLNTRTLARPPLRSNSVPALPRLIRGQR